MNSEIIVVEGFAPCGDNNLHLRNNAIEIALDQRVFGRLLVGVGTREGDLLVLAHAPRTDPLDLALEACRNECGQGAETAVAFCDELVEPGQTTEELGDRLEDARAVAAWFGIHLVDWVSATTYTFVSAAAATRPPTIGGSCPRRPHRSSAPLPCRGCSGSPVMSRGRSR